MTALTILTLGDNPLDALPDLSGALALVHLDLSGLSLAQLPDWLARLPKLAHLHLGRTPALDLADACRHLADHGQLRMLRLGGPHLTALPDAVAAMTSLEVVRIEDSPALDFEAAFTILARLPRLRELRLPRNGLTAVPAGVVALAATLERLDLDDNPIEEVPRALGSFARLKGLDLGGTRVTLLPREFARLTLSFHRFPPGMQRET